MSPSLKRESKAMKLITDCIFLLFSLEEMIELLLRLLLLSAALLVLVSESSPLL